MAMTKIAVFLAISLSITCSSAAAMRCGGSLVALGETKFEVLAKCGSPYFMSWLSTEENIEQIAYNQGPGTLLKILTFKEGMLASIKDGARVDREIHHQTPFIAKTGDLQADIYLKYGAPAYREFVDGNLEQWIYDFGRGSFLKVLLFREGRLVDIKERKGPYRRTPEGISGP